MATRSTVKFFETYSDGEVCIAAIYQQFDGYISGVGHALAKWLETKEVINGISRQTMEQGFANGMGCLAAQFIATFKTKIGGLYMTSPDNSQDYNYEVRNIDGQFIITVDEFKGTPQELLAYDEEDRVTAFCTVKVREPRPLVS